jgi:osmotically-inducible protein OsmY
MKTDLHGDVIAGMSATHDLDHQQVTAATKVPGCWPERDQATWSACDDQELTGDQADRLLSIVLRPDADVEREVLRELFLEGLVPLTVDARVADGIVTLAGTVWWEQERRDAKQAVGWVPGVLGIIDDLVCLQGPGTSEAVRQEVAAALARSRVADVAGLTVDERCPGTMVLSCAVRTCSDHDLAITTAWSVAGVGAVDDCIDLEW